MASPESESFTTSSRSGGAQAAISAHSPGSRALRLGAAAVGLGLFAAAACQAPAAQAFTFDPSTILLSTRSHPLPVEVSIPRTVSELDPFSSSGWNFDPTLVETLSPVWNFSDGTTGPIQFIFGESTGSTEPPKKADVVPLAQSNPISCGQASVAVAINSLKGTNLRDTDIHRAYGFDLLGALNAESRAVGVRWEDAGNFTPSKWPVIEEALQQKMPVVIGLNGREFSPTGRGHIVTITSIEGEKVFFADSAKGVIRDTSRANIERAPGHPHGKFIFVPTRAGS